MTTNKDYKRIVRARMVRTGESYTAARAHLQAQADPARAALPRVADHATLAGMSDAAIKAGTGCDWRKWVEALDYRKAHEWSHREIAAYVREKFRLSSWWSQGVTVGYERIKGLRAIGQRRGGDFDASKSKTFNVALSRLYNAFGDKRNRNKWLGPVELTVKTAIRGRSMRITWSDGKPVEMSFVAKAPGKSTVTVTHHRLPDRAAVDRVQAEWAARLEALGALLSR